MQTAGDLSFELVAKDGSTTIDVDDHGKDKPTAGATGTMTVLMGTQKTELPLASGGNNTLVVTDYADNLERIAAVIARRMSVSMLTLRTPCLIPSTISETGTP